MWTYRARPLRVIDGDTLDGSGEDLADALLDTLPEPDGDDGAR